MLLGNYKSCPIFLEQGCVVAKELRNKKSLSPKELRNFYYDGTKLCISQAFISAVRDSKSFDGYDVQLHLRGFFKNERTEKILSLVAVSGTSVLLKHETAFAYMYIQDFISLINDSEVISYIHGDLEISKELAAFCRELIRRDSGL